jgi:hypothetical protein
VEQEADKKSSVTPIVARSLIIWLALTVALSTMMVFRPGLDFARANDNYLGYWDYRLGLFLIPWVGISMPLWVFGTWIVLRLNFPKH